MKIVITPVAVFVMEDSKVVEEVKLGKDAKECARKFAEGEIDKIVEELKEKYKAEVVEKPADLKFLIERGYFKNEDELKKFINEFGIYWTKIKIKKSYTPDKIIIQAIDFIDDLNEIINKFYERLREWYGVYFPEFVKNCDDMEKFFKILAESPEREKAAEKIGIPAESMGLDFTEEDLSVLHEVAKIGYALTELKERVAKYIRKLMEENYPNFTKLAGPLVGAKLISLAGGVDQLVKLPASTIQVLGAEKALFRHLTKGTAPPKHGVLFQHPLVHRMPKKLRGKIARTLAAKLAIAIRVDYYSKGKQYIADKLLKEIEERIKEIKEEAKGE